jgi:hypothetical protein
VQSIYDSATLAATDIKVESGATYYYQVVVYNRFGQSSASGSMSVTTETDPPPGQSTAVQLSAGEAVVDPDLSSPLNFSVPLSWTKNNDDNFLEYDVYRALTQAGHPSAPSDATYLRSFFGRDVLEFTDRGLLRGGTYYYTIVVRNNTLAGPATSNTVQVNVPE